MSYDFENYRGAFDKDLKMPAKKLPMGWYKFLVNFALWASAAINLIGALSYLGATAHTEEIYAKIPVLAPVDTAYGVLTVGMGALAIAAALALRGYKRSGPALVVAVYVYGLCISLGYNIACIALMSGEYEAVEYIITGMSVGFSAMVSAAFAICNYIYFKKRKNLFTK